jgi:pimeloyl-ACP methyl ester carboxylesterase
VLELSQEEIDALRTSPLWPTRLAAAHTVPREARAEAGWVYAPGQFDGITAPTLLLTGSESVPAVVKATHEAAGAIPGARVHVLEGHGHFAHKSDPAMVSALIREFVGAAAPTPSGRPRPGGRA